MDRRIEAALSVVSEEKDFIDGTSPVRAKLKWFNGQKGFGFVIPDGDDNDAFLHVTTLQRAGANTIGEGADMICHLSRGPKGAMVTEVTEILSYGTSSGGAVTQISPPINNNDSNENEDISVMTGTVKWFKDDKGFGFIIPEDGGKDIFVHKACLDLCHLPALDAGQKVRVTLRSVAKGREAVEVSLL